MIIFDAGLEEGVIREGIDRVLDHVRSRGGSIGTVDRWGKRTFAYELKHHREGYYVVVEMTTTPEVVAEVDRMLFLSDEVLRHKVVRPPEAAKSPQPAKPLTDTGAPATS
jgi:small subunit ribosomal protein S6